MCWGSLIRRHIKAIQLIDEAFYKRGVKSSCHTLSFLFFNRCVSLWLPPPFPSTPSCHGVLPEVPPCIWTGGLLWPWQVQNLPLPGWGRANCRAKRLQQAMLVLLLCDHPKQLKRTLFPSGWDTAFISASPSCKQGMETHSQTRGAWTPDGFGTTAGQTQHRKVAVLYVEAATERQKKGKQASTVVYPQERSWKTREANHQPNIFLSQFWQAQQTTSVEKTAVG